MVGVRLDICVAYQLVAKELLAAEALAIDPDQIKIGLQVADQIPGFNCADANGSGQKQIGAVAAIPEPASRNPRQ